MSIIKTNEEFVRRIYALLVKEGINNAWSIACDIVMTKEMKNEGA